MSWIEVYFKKVTGKAFDMDTIKNLIDVIVNEMNEVGGKYSKIVKHDKDDNEIDLPDRIIRYSLKEEGLEFLVLKNNKNNKGALITLDGFEYSYREYPNMNNVIEKFYTEDNFIPYVIKKLVEH